MGADPTDPRVELTEVGAQALLRERLILLDRSSGMRRAFASAA